MSPDLGQLAIVLLGMITLSQPLSLLAGCDDETVAQSSPALGKLFIDFGDSNTVGQGDTDHMDNGYAWKSAFPSVQYRSQYATGVTNPPVWITYGTTDLQPYAAGGGPGMGIELTQGRELYRLLGAGVFVGKFAMNGSTAADWHPTALTPATAGVNLYNQLVAYIHARITESGQQLGGITISLSTNDASDATLAANYGTNIAAIISALRTEFGSGLPIVLRKLNAAASPPNVATVRAAQVTYAAGDALCKLLYEDDLALTDGFHYDADGYSSIGQRDAYAFADLSSYGRVVVAGSVPAFVGGDTAVHGAGALSPRPWNGVQNNDKEILVVVCGLQNAASSISLSSAQGFTALGAEQVSTFSTLKQRIQLYQRDVVTASLVNGRMPTPTVADTNDLNLAAIFTFRSPTGAAITATALAGAVNNAFNTTLSLTGGTTTTANNLIARFVSGYNNLGTASLLTTDGVLTSVAEQYDTIQTIGSDYEMIGLNTGVKAAAGATGAASVTASQNCILAGVSISLAP